MSLRHLPAISHRLTLTLVLLPLACALLLSASTLDVPRAGAQGRMNHNTLPSTAAPRSEVYGRVVYEDTGRPVRRASVSLMRNGEREDEYETVTDGRGQFRFKGVRKGKYYVAVDAPGVLTPHSFPTQAEMGDSDADEVGKNFDSIEVDGKADKEVTVRARRGGAISGRVTYADGDPAVNATIYVMRRSGERVVKIMGGLTRRMMTGLRTDDRGIYRVAGLPAGEYVVAVSETANHGAHESAGSDDGVSSYMLQMMSGSILNYQLLMTFHPSAPNLKDATVVNLDVGEERDGVDIEIANRAARSLTGVVRDRRDKSPVRGAKLTITRKDGAAAPGGAPLYASTSAQNTVETDEQGRFLLREIPEGQYSIFVNPPDELEYDQRPVSGRATMNSNMSISSESYMPPRRRKKHAPLKRDVQVSGDGSELLIELGEGARVSGTITAEGGRQLPDYSSVYATAASPTDGSAGVMLHSATSHRGEFVMDGLPPGQYFLRTYSQSDEQEEVYVKSITWNGKDLLQEPLEVAEGQTVAGVQIVYASDAASLRVRVVSGPDASPAVALTVGLVPLDMTRWSPYGRPVFCMTGEDGSCVMRSAPGEYRVIALTRSVTATTFEAEIRRLALTAPRVSLRPRESETLEMVVPER